VSCTNPPRVQKKKKGERKRRRTPVLYVPQRRNPPGGETAWRIRFITRGRKKKKKKSECPINPFSTWTQSHKKRGGKVPVMSAAPRPARKEEPLFQTHGVLPMTVNKRSRVLVLSFRGRSWRGDVPKFTTNDYERGYTIEGDREGKGLNFILSDRGKEG